MMQLVLNDCWSFPHFALLKSIWMHGWVLGNCHLSTNLISRSICCFDEELMPFYAPNSCPGKIDVSYKHTCTFAKLTSIQYKVVPCRFCGLEFMTKSESSTVFQIHGGSQGRTSDLPCFLLFSKFSYY